jgi:hypothetical protein
MSSRSDSTRRMVAGESLLHRDDKELLEQSSI